MHGARLCFAALLAGLVVGSFGQAYAGQLPLLTSADEIRHLTPEQAALGYPVRIRGVVTVDTPRPHFFIQNNTGGIYVEGNRALASKRNFGDLIELEGVTGPGRFAPVIQERNTRVLGKGTLPQATLHSLSELVNGQLDSQWVKVRGLVRSVWVDRVTWGETTLAMNVASGGRVVKVRVPITHDVDVNSWIDSEVLIEGVCGALFNNKRQFEGVLFYVPRLSYIERVEPPAKDVPIASLLLFSPDERTGHRVRIQGVVTHQVPGSALFVQNADKGLRVLTQQETLVKRGDVVDVLGFPAVGESSPILEDSSFRVVGHQGQPTPARFDATVNWEGLDGALVTVQAELQALKRESNGVSLVLQQSGTVFTALLQGMYNEESLPSLRIGSVLNLTGICLVRNEGPWTGPLSFRILLRSPNDIQVVKAPSWWTLTHTFWVLGITAGVLLLVIAWVVVLGRRVREQMEVIRRKLRSGAVLEERNRIARELHDTLEQELVGITMQLDLAADCFDQAPAVARQAIEMATSMSRHSMIEARRSVWDLRCHWLNSGDLVSALKNAIEAVEARSQAKIHVKATGKAVRLSSVIEMNLLRIGQEAVTNAVQHAEAENVEVLLKYEPEFVLLRVSDDGRGFLPEDANLKLGGHFGLPDMRERALAMGSGLTVDSAPGAGTRIEVRVLIHSEHLVDAAEETNTYSCS